jgi:N,N'-diacetyllegionaminate synthase
MPVEIPIGNHIVSGDRPPFIIAEAGVNHNNQPALAMDLIRAAADAGADAIKFQNYSADRLATKNAPVYWDVPGAEKFDSQYELFSKLDSLPGEAYLDMMSLAQELGIEMFSSPFSEFDADFLDDIDVPAYKIASPDITHIPLLRHVARKGKPIVLSTGISTLGEIEDALQVIEAEGNRQIVLLHCTSTYPAPMSDSNLRMMATMQTAFPDYHIGLSDHTYGMTAPIAATALGCRMIEKHFTLDKNLPDSPDHKFGVDPIELKTLVDETRGAWMALGQASKKPIESEIPALNYMRRSVVTSIDIPAGALITSEMIACKRPGTGIAPKHFDEVVGRRAKEDIPADEVLQWDALS